MVCHPEDRNAYGDKKKARRRRTTWHFTRKNGFIRYPGFFSREEVAALREAIDQAIETNRERIVGAPGGGRSSEAYEKVFNQMVNLWTDFPDVKAYSFNHAMAETARRLTGSRHVRIYHDHAMVKPGGTRQPGDELAPGYALLADGAGRSALGLGGGGRRDGPKTGAFTLCRAPIKWALRSRFALGVAGESIVNKMSEKGHEVAEPVAMEMTAGGLTFHHGCNFHHAGANPDRQAAPGIRCHLHSGLRPVYGWKGSGRGRRRDGGWRSMGTPAASNSRGFGVNGNHAVSETNLDSKFFGEVKTAYMQVDKGDLTADYQDTPGHWT